MAEDIRECDSGNGDLTQAHKALVKECREQSRNTLYTSTSFFIWLRWLKVIRAILWIIAVAAGAAAASTVLSRHENLELLIAALALLGVILPGTMQAVKLDETIDAYRDAAGRFKNVEGALRRAADIWSHKPWEEFEKEARAALAALDKARECALTPPEWCFKAAQRKVQSGDYDPEPAKE
ncbi:hypothetical protein [Nitratireductor aquibiodomus]|uniref:hypothetical protein n=1 Tax=Nitratireductor aquibiodomus TaxID=204799 RepID=UPI00046A0C7A|nr:hypothetical protein [Nitratireductor aquibiodomus]